MPTEADKYINLSSLTIEQKTSIQVEVEKYVQDYQPFYAQFFDTKAYKQGYKKFSWRRQIRPEVTDFNTTPLVEGYGAYPSKISVAEYESDYEDLGTYVDYTKESLRAFDDLKSMATSVFESYATEVPDRLLGQALAGTTFTMTASADAAYKYTLTFDKAAVILKRLKNKKAGGRQHWLAVTTPEVVAGLKAELRAHGDVLPEAVKTEITKEGGVYSYDGIDIVERDDDFLTVTGSGSEPKKYLILFVSLDREGRKAGIYTPEAIDIFDNGLGSGDIKDPTSGEMVPDRNHRAGSLAMNIDHFGAALYSDAAVLKCEIDATEYTATTTPTVHGQVGATQTAPTVFPTTPTTGS